MQFHEKLSQLMALTQISNKALATELHVDASLVSRWRTGERVPQRNAEYYAQMAACFAAAVPRYQRHSLLALMNLPPEATSGQGVTLASLIQTWLEKANSDSTHDIIESFLHKAEAANRVDPLSQLTEPSFTSQGLVLTSSSYFGQQGMRDATMRILTLLLNIDEPTTLYMFSDHLLDWMNNAPQYEIDWRERIAACLSKGHRICVIHNIVRNYFELFSIIERWLPFYLTGQVDTFYCPRHFSSVYNNSICIIPDHAALTCQSVMGCEDSAECVYTTNKPSLDAIMSSFRQHLALSEPLFHIFTPKHAKQLQDEHLRVLYAPGNMICMNNMLSSITMPEELFARIIGRFSANATERRSMLELFRLKQKIFHQNLKSYSYRELVILPDPDQVRKNGLVMNLSMFLGTQGEGYTKYEDIKKHIAHMIWLLENCPNYQCYLLREMPFKNLQIQAKENNGLVFTTEKDSFYTFCLTQPNMSHAFYNYLENLLLNIPKQGHDRAYTIAKMKAYLED